MKTFLGFLQNNPIDKYKNLIHMKKQTYLLMAILLVAVATAVAGNKNGKFVRVSGHINSEFRIPN